MVKFLCRIYMPWNKTNVSAPTLALSILPWVSTSMKNHPKDYHLKLDVEAKTNEKKGLYIYPIVHCNACRSCITRHDVEGDKLKYADGTHTAVPCCSEG